MNCRFFAPFTVLENLRPVVLKLWPMRAGPKVMATSQLFCPGHLLLSWEPQSCTCLPHNWPHIWLFFTMMVGDLAIGTGAEEGMVSSNGPMGQLHPQTTSPSPLTQLVWLSTCPAGHSGMGTQHLSS